MANSVEDGFINLEYGPRRFPYVPRASWPVPFEQTMSQADNRHRRTTTTAATTAPLRTAGQGFTQTTYAPTFLNDWQLQQQLQYTQAAAPSLDQGLGGAFSAPYNASPIDFMSSTQAPIDASLQLEIPFVPLGGQAETMPFSWQDFQTDLMGFTTSGGLPDLSLNQRNLAENSPTDTYLEVRSLTSSSSDNGWATIDYRQSFDSSYHDAQAGAIFNPSETLHIRTNSDSSHSDAEYSRNSFGSFEEVPFPLNSPESDSHMEFGYQYHDTLSHYHEHPHGHAGISPSAGVDPVPIKEPSSPQRSPVATSPARKQSRKSPIAKATKPVIRRPSHTTKKDNEKRVGRRTGPLRPDQRKQAHEIRKIKACLRCKFLKKTCDKGEPCGGCQPSHARLWQVPCTRIDIKDIGYFMKDYKADFERHVSLNFSVSNVKGFSNSERKLFITHGYGFVLPVTAREVFVRDENCFGMDWVESIHDVPREFAVATAKLSAGMEGISTSLLSEYLDRHIDEGFEKFIDEYFEGTPFLTQILKTAHRYYLRERLPVVRKALKLVLAYNLTMHVTMVDGLSKEERIAGEIKDDGSKFRGKTVAPVMINFQVKCALADMWRELQKDILEELSSLYSGVYSGDKLKNWPTIFILAAILLAVWEEMQFDCHYRVPDPNAVEKFCSDMETTPVGVIVGLFSAISQKLPAFSEWDTRKHHHLLNSNPAVCDAMTEVKDHVLKHENYLKSRANTQFDRKDFDCLSNKFLSKLVIRAN